MAILDQIQNYLPLITTVVVIIGWFIRLESKSMINGTRLDKIETRNEVRDRESDGFREQMLVTLQEVKTTLEYVKQSLQRLERK